LNGTKGHNHGFKNVWHSSVACYQASLCLPHTCSKREPQDVEEAEGAEAAAAAVGGRDVFNEKPSLEDIMTAEGAGACNLMACSSFL